eukprot:419698_1
MLRLYRKLGCLEQKWTIFHNYNIGGIGTGVSFVKINGLSKISDEKIQNISDRIHAKYEALQCQILSIDDVNEYDTLYIGVSPPKIKRYDDDTLFHKLVAECLNFKFKLLNDFGLNDDDDIKQGDYNIKDIEPLYFRLICGDNLITYYCHVVLDLPTEEYYIRDFLCLLNDDDNNFSPETVQHSRLEDCIDDQYASKPSIISPMLQYIPKSWLNNVFAFYANNSILSKYNPLSVHKDILLTFKHIYNEKHNILSFPLFKKSSYSKWDWRIDYEVLKIPKKITLAIIKQVKLHKVFMNSFLQYMVATSMIDVYIDIGVLKKDYYQTIIGSTFDTRPLYSNPNKTYCGCHVHRIVNSVEYHKNIKINSNEFWNEINKVSKQIPLKNIASYYKNVFPLPNYKKIFLEAFLNRDGNGLIGKKSLVFPVVTNTGRKQFNKQYYKYKAIEYCAATNPFTGFGNAYCLLSATIDGINEMNLCFHFAKQFITKDIATKVLNKVQEKMNAIASQPLILKSKL